MFIAVACLYWN